MWGTVLPSARMALSGAPWGCGRSSQTPGACQLLHSVSQLQAWPARSLEGAFLLFSISTAFSSPDPNPPLTHLLMSTLAPLPPPSHVAARQMFLEDSLHTTLLGVLKHQFHTPEENNQTLLCGFEDWVYHFALGS